MELIETIISNKLPTEKKVLYERVHMTNTQTTRFKTINESITRYISEVEYTKFNGFLPKDLLRNNLYIYTCSFAVFMCYKIFK